MLQSAVRSERRLQLINEGEGAIVRNDENEDRRSGHDRRQNSDSTESHRLNLWANPQLWLSVMGLLLTIGMAVLGYIASQLSTIQASVQTTRDLVLQSTAKQTAEITELRGRIEKLENDMDTQTKAYNYNITTRLAVVEAKIGVSRKEGD